MKIGEPIKRKLENSFGKLFDKLLLKSSSFERRLDFLINEELWIKVALANFNIAKPIQREIINENGTK